MNTVFMCQVHHLSTERKGEKPTNCLNAHLQILANLILQVQMSQINEGFELIFPPEAKMLLHNMTVIEKEEMEFPVLCYLVAWKY